MILHIHLDQPLIKALQEEADEKGCSVAGLVKKLMREHTHAARTNFNSKENKSNGNQTD